MVFERAGERNGGLAVSSMLSRPCTEGEELVVYRQTQTGSDNMKVKLAFQSIANQRPQTYNFSEVVVGFGRT